MVLGDAGADRDCARPWPVPAHPAARLLAEQAAVIGSKGADEGWNSSTRPHPLVSCLQHRPEAWPEVLQSLDAVLRSAVARARLMLGHGLACPAPGPASDFSAARSRWGGGHPTPQSPAQPRGVGVPGVGWRVGGDTRVKNGCSCLIACRVNSGWQGDAPRSCITTPQGDTTRSCAAFGGHMPHPLAHTVARHCCKAPLQGTTAARHHWKAHLQAPLSTRPEKARHHCKHH